MMAQPAKAEPAVIRQQILNHLKTLKISLAEPELDELLSEATRENFSYGQFLARFLTAPAHTRRERSIERRIRLARFPDPAATLESFDWKFNAKTIDSTPFRELATGDFIRRRENVAFVGESGLGKSHLVQGVGRACCAAGYRVRYVTSAELLEELTAALADKTLSGKIRYYQSFELLVIDEFGFDKLERREYPDAPSLLYKVIDARNRRGSTALVTNIDFRDWTEYLGDGPLVMATLDRVVDNAITIKFTGKSYRKYRAEQKKRDLPTRSVRETQDQPSPPQSTP
jgi:DNA replication protein DnaC